MANRWRDLVDPTPDDVLAVMPVPVDPEVVEILATRSREGRDPRPVIEGHGGYVFGVLVAMLPNERTTDVVVQEVDIVATAGYLVTVRKTPVYGPPYDVSVIEAASQTDAPVGILVRHLFDDVADSFLHLLDTTYAEIDTLEDEIDDQPAAHIRRRIADIRHELLHRRRTVSATRAAVRRIMDGRVDAGEHALFPTDVERLFGDTYDMLVRAAEDIDVARDLLGGVRDHLQSKIAENQNEVGKKLTVIASLVLVPSLVVGFFGQNFEGEFDRTFWTLGFSTGLILISTAVQLTLFRWRRWI